MKKILKKEVQKLKKQMESNVYNTDDGNLPNKKYYCGGTDCGSKVKREDIIFYVDNEAITMFCKKCGPNYMKDYIINKLKRETTDMLYEVGKEEEKGE